MRRYLLLASFALGLMITPSAFAQADDPCVENPTPCAAPTDTYYNGGSQPAPQAQAAASSLDAQYQQCEEERQIAREACTNPDSTAGQGNKTKQYLQAIAIAGTMAAQASAATGNAAICAAAAGLSSAAQVVSMMKGDACEKTYKTCSRTCITYFENAESEIRRLRPQETTNAVAAAEIVKLQRQKTEARQWQQSCNRYEAQVTQSVAQYMMLAQTVTTGIQCATAMSSKPGATATPPSLDVGATDCSNASYASTSMVCICRATPTDPMCGGINNPLQPGSGGMGGSLAGTTPTLGSGEVTDGELVDQSAIAAAKQSGSYEGGSGGGGSGLGNSGGGGLLGGDGDGGAAGSGLDKNVIQGTSGSGGGGVSALAAGGGSGGGGARGSSGGGSDKGFNLSKFLPKSLLKNRGLAGMTVPSTDGITGPMGPSIWEKVTNRYQQQKSNLIQDK